MPACTLQKYAKNNYGTNSYPEETTSAFKATLKRDVGFFGALNLIIGLMVGKCTGNART